MWVISAQKEKHCFHIDHGDNKAGKYVFENVGQNIIRGWFMNFDILFWHQQMRMYNTFQNINVWNCRLIYVRDVKILAEYHKSDSMWF